MGCGASAPAPVVPVASNPVSQHVVSRGGNSEVILSAANDVTSGKAVGIVDGLSDSIALLTQAGTGLIDWNSDAARAAADFLEFGGETLKTIAHIIIPPPGGQVLAAVLAIAYIVVKASRNVTICKELALRCAKLIVHVAQDQEKNGIKASIREDMLEFQRVAEDIKVFVDDVAREGWIKRLLHWTKTSSELEDFEKDLNELTHRLQFGAVMDMHAIISASKADAENLDAMVKDAGGADKLLKDPQAMSKFQSYLSGTEAVLVGGQSTMIQLLKEMGAANSAGPHNVIEHPVISSFWREHFTTESVSWITFWAAFPRKVVAAEDVKISLEEELKDIKERKLFQDSVDLEDANTVSVAELHAAFPHGKHLGLQVKSLKESFKLNGCISNLPLAVDHFRGRDFEVDRIVTHISQGDRLVVVTGGPGEGKLTAVIKAAGKMHGEVFVGGMYYCEMAKANTVNGVESSLKSGLCKVEKQGNAMECVRGRLGELAALDMPVLFVMDDCEEVFAEPTDDNDDSASDEVGDMFQKYIKEMLTKIPRLHIILISRVMQELEGVKPMSPKEVRLETLEPAAAGEILRSVRPSVSAADALVIADNFGCNPQLMQLVGGYLNNGKLDLEAAKNSTTEDDIDIGKEYKKLKKSVLHSLKLLDEKVRVSLLQLSFLPAYFDACAIQSVLGMNAMTCKSRINDLLQSSLIQKAPGSEESYKIVPMIRDIARVVIKEEKTAEKMGLKPANMEECKKKYIMYCLNLVSNAFRQYMTAPQAAYNLMSKSKINVQQGLLMIAGDKNASEESVGKYLDILQLLPYIDVYDKTIVQRACNSMAAVCKRGSNPFGEATCKAVASLFYVNNSESVTASLQLAQEAKALLESATEPREKLLLAMALRAEGLLYREKYDFDQSIAAHQAAIECLADVYTKFENRQGEMERIIVMAELAGTMDWCGKFEEGRLVAEEAIAVAEAFFGADVPHPIMALCLTANGYHVKAQGMAAAAGSEEAKAFHTKAVEMHERARVMRVSVLGAIHVEVAISLNQKALSLQELGDFKASEEAYRQSLDMRIKCLGERDPMVANTYNALANLYKAMNRLAADPGSSDDGRNAEHSLVKALSIRRFALSPTHKKSIQTAEELAKLLRDLGREADAQSVESK